MKNSALKVNFDKAILSKSEGSKIKGGQADEIGKKARNKVSIL